MIRYAVYLEPGPGGLCMAHVPDLPGCTLRVARRALVAEQLPAAARGYWAWLRVHGEAAPPPDERIELEVAGESEGLGPFNPGDAAALFAPDLTVVTQAEQEYLLRLMAHSRTDLLVLVEGLRDDLLDWKPGPDQFSIRQVLRHVGNAEEWYVSRLVPPEALPVEWQDDDRLPVLSFLAMERRTAVELLCNLTEEQRSQVFHPVQWTAHPEEAWTLRKVLRRFLEHEREHAGQVCEIRAEYERAVSVSSPRGSAK